jgi:hypothetical protein
MLSWIIIVLAHWNNSLWRDMSPHSDTLSWFWANVQTLIGSQIVGSNPDRVGDCGFKPWSGQGLWVQTLIGSRIVGSNPDHPWPDQDLNPQSLTRSGFEPTILDPIRVWTHNTQPDQGLNPQSPTRSGFEPTIHDPIRVWTHNLRPNQGLNLRLCHSIVVLWLFIFILLWYIEL